MYFTPNSYRAGQAEHRGTVKVLVVHHVVEREAGIGAGCWQNLKECSVVIAGGIRITATERVAGAEPRIEHANDRLPAEFANKSASTVDLRSPTAILQRSPQQKIELAVRVRMIDMDVVGTVGADADLILVGGTQRKRTVIRFQDRSSLIHITQREDSQFTGAGVGIDGNGERAVKEVHMYLTHGIDLKDAASRPSTKKSDVTFTCVESQPHPIETPTHSGKTEVADQPLSDAGIDKRCETLVLLFDFGAIQKR